MAFTDEELERYARHILLHEVGGQGQQRLKNAKVLVIGAGGLGAPVLLYLAAAGVGTLGVIDDDVVSLSNLQRQVIHTTPRVGMLKTDSTAAMLKDINPNVSVETWPERLTADNAMDIIGRYDLVSDGCDNFATRFLSSDACYLAGKTLVSGAVGQFDGQVSTFKPHEKMADGTPYPSYRCLHEEAPPEGSVPNCSEVGIIGAITGIIGCIQAMEIIKEITGIGDSLAGSLLMYDALAARSYTAKLNWREDNPLSGRNPTITDLSAHR
ncbi:MAG: molybdopterin-synthase adenylyltransferase MoeB [Rhizobiales bacterium]|nr:molybdopterin-synthase adenylyltransferase MoeB [Hyphomicrobiales bacterium]